jgi:hypothetical protein
MGHGDNKIAETCKRSGIMQLWMDNQKEVLENGNELYMLAGMIEL